MIATPTPPAEETDGMLQAVPGSELFVWWLMPSDYQGFEPHQERNPLLIPDYAWEQFCSLCGRAGRGRLWVPDHIKIDRLPIDADDDKWKDNPVFLASGGIVIEARHADDCARWGGLITTLTLDPVEPQNDQALPHLPEKQI